ncbi:MAG TPA: pyruvate kinase, partial [Candidatus Ozemobacteraceae bacterium]|nr:pyruvate kinase [Candidatus Ozemobacteraceae bacterium]
PASSTPEIIGKLIEAGVNIFRLNFSHGTHESHQQLVDTVRGESKRLGKHIGLLGDLCGPKIRIGTFPAGSVTLTAGQKFSLSQNPDLPGSETGVGTTYPYLVKDLNPGDAVLLDDGNLTLRVESKGTDFVSCVVVDGGILKNKKGMNMPGANLSVETITAKDREDLKFMIAQELDFVALSFVRRGSDLRELRQLIGSSPIRVVAKIEKPEAIDDLEAILAETDSVMIARGDLGVEMPIEKVPAIQKHIITRCTRRGIEVITATQMLESMIINPRPTRAETTDVFNAVVDGTDAIMLSGETAAGAHPVESVKTMASIALEAERLLKNTSDSLLPEVKHDIEDVMAHAACESAINIGAKAIVPFTHSGNTARNISKYHPETLIYALTPKPDTCRRLSLSWGVTPVLIQDLRDTDAMIACAEKTMLEKGLAKSGDIVVIVAGVPLGVKGNTNMIKVHRIR